MAAGLGLGAMSLATGLAGTASAAPTLPDASQADYSLTIHKYVGDSASTTPGTGGPQTPGAGYTPVAGVEFSWQRVDGIDLFSNLGWECANTLSAAFNGSGVFPTLTCDYDGDGVVDPGETIALSATAQGDFDPTDANGTTSIDQNTPNFTMGLYLVTEDAATVPTGYTAAAPFLVAVPMTTNDGEDWNYDVEVYPKNVKPGTTKTVNDATDYNVGSVIDYVITADLGGVPQGTTPDETYSITGFHIVDALPENVRTTNVTVQDLSITLIDSAGAQIAVIGPNEYVFDLYQDYATAVAGVANHTQFPGNLSLLDGTGTGQWMVLSINAQGLIKLMAAQNSPASYPAKIRMAFSAQVIAAGKHTNTAYVFPDPQSWTAGNPPETPPTVDSYYGRMDFIKYGLDGSDRSPLAGAIFQVWAITGEPGLSGNAATCANLDPNTTDPATGVGPQAIVDETGLESTSRTPVASDGNGRFFVNGLHYSNFVNGRALNLDLADDRALHITYCLVETQAPPGWARLAEAIPFEISSLEATTAIEINDVKANGGFDLPLTGAAGAAMVIGVGTILAGAGALLVIATRRRNRTHSLNIL